MPTGFSPALRSASDERETMSRRAATTTTSIVGSPVSRRIVADDLLLEDRLVERHRDLVLGLEADRGLELLATSRSRAGAASARRPAGWRSRGGPSSTSLCSAKRSFSARQGLGVGRPRPRGRRRTASGAMPAPETRAAPFDAHLGGGDAAGLEIEADDAVVLALA